jgi:hypothetical protein
MIEFELTEEKPDETTRGGFGSTDTKGWFKWAAK